MLKSSAKLQQAENSVVREQGGESMHKHQKKKKKKVLAHIERMCDYFILWDSSCKWAENLQVR